MDIDGIFVPFYPKACVLKGISRSSETRRHRFRGRGQAIWYNKEIYARISDVEEFVGDDGDDEEGALCRRP